MSQDVPYRYRFKNDDLLYNHMDKFDFRTKVDFLHCFRNEIVKPAQSGKHNVESYFIVSRMWEEKITGIDLGKPFLSVFKKMAAWKTKFSILYDQIGRNIYFE
jgi:hypothetical protein